MALYSVKKSRGRKIKKYRKSRRGKGRGKINLKCGKTRRYKVFKNTKNHTLGKRKGRGRGRGRGRQMIGGLAEWIENDDVFNNLMKDYINAKYKYKIIKDTNQDTTLSGFSEVKQMCNKVVMITNKSKGSFLREENQLQRLLIYSCHMNGGESAMMRGGGGQSDPIFCYALVRVPDLLYKNNDNGPPIVGMNDKILFIRPELGSVINIDMSSLTKQEQYETLESYKKNLIQSIIKKTNETLKQLQKEKINKAYIKEQEKKLKVGLENKLKHIKSMSYSNFCESFRCYEFESFISSSGDKYRIFMSIAKNIPISMQCSLFDTLSNTQENPSENPSENLPENPQENLSEQHEEQHEEHDEKQNTPNIGSDEAVIPEDDYQQVHHG